MNNTSTTTDTPNQRDIAALEFARLVLPEDMTAEEIARFRENIQAAATATRPVILPFIRPAPESTATPSDVRVEVVKQFELGGLRIEAVRVTYRGAGLLLLKDALRAADTGGKVIRSEEHWKRIHADRANMPSDLEDYRLITARPDPGHPSHVSGLRCGMRGWYWSWYGLEGNWYSDGLVLRLCT